MKLQVNPRLFWFLKEGTTLNLSQPANLDLYIQQVLSRGMSEDVTHLLEKVPPENFKQSFERVKRFLPDEVKKFWEDFFEDHHADSEDLP